MDKNNISLTPKHKHDHYDYHYNSSNYRDSHMLKMYQANIIISLDHKSKVNILKHRFGCHNSDIPLAETICILSEILSRNIFGNYLDMFRESLKEQIIKSINETIKEGVAKCEPYFMNEQ